MSDCFSLIESNDLDGFKEEVNQNPVILLNLNKENYTPFQVCCIKGKTDFLKFLIQFSKNLGMILSDIGETCLMLTAHNNHLRSFLLILENYPEQKSQITFSNDTFAHIAVKYQSYDIIKYIVDNKIDNIDFNAKNKSKHTPLYNAISKKDQKLVDLIMPLINEGLIGKNTRNLANSYKISLEIKKSKQKIRDSALTPSPTRRHHSHKKKLDSNSKLINKTPDAKITKLPSHQSKDEIPQQQQLKQCENLKQLIKNHSKQNKTDIDKTSKEYQNQPPSDQIKINDKTSNINDPKPKKRRRRKIIKKEQETPKAKEDPFKFEINELSELLEKRNDDIFVEKYKEYKAKYDRDFVKTKDYKERLLIHVAAKYDHENEEIIETLIKDYPESLKIANQNNRIPLLISICNGAIDTCKLLCFISPDYDMEESVISSISEFLKNYKIASKKYTAKDFLQLFADMDEFSSDRSLKSIQGACKNACKDLLSIEGLSHKAKRIAQDRLNELSNIVVLIKK